MQKKMFTIFCVSAFSMTTFSQVGIHTAHPQASFHVDGGKDNSSSKVPDNTQQNNDFSVTNTGNVGLGTVKPTERLDVISGNVRIRTINSNIGTGGKDRAVVADSQGVLKTVDFKAYSLFHARLAAKQHLEDERITTLQFSSPLVTSPFYSYSTRTGILTFNEPGNYMVTLQGSFTSAPDGTQFVLGIRPNPDADYLGRGSHFNPPRNTQVGSSSVGELMNYTTVLIVPRAGYQIRFVATSNKKSIILSTETGNSGSGNVTNVTVQKI